MKDSYLGYLVEVLNNEPLLGISHEVEIAKGTYKLTEDTIEEKLKIWRLSKL
jgi:hypothetical protein